jgi:hypothetical protein
MDWINQHHPSMLVLTEEGGHLAPAPGGGAPRSFTETQWPRGVSATLAAATSPGTTKVVLGETPALPDAPVPCLRRNPKKLQACSTPDRTATPIAYVNGEEAAARQAGARYIDALPWFCSVTCPAVVGKYVVYMDDNHVTATYARYLETVLGQSLSLTSSRS